MAEFKNGMTVSSRLVTRNAGYNMLGYIIPALVAIIAIKYLQEGLGDERIAILVLVWSIVGYLGLFDLGISRGVVRFMSEALTKGDEKRLKEVYWAANFLLIILGLMAGFLLAVITPWIVNSLLKIPQELVTETTGAFFLSALSLPFIIATSGQRVVLESQQRFAIINLIRVPLSVGNYLVPLGVLLFVPRLDYVVGTLLFLRIIGFVVHLVVVSRTVPQLRKPQKISKAIMRELLSFGGWLTISRIVGPIMLYLDKFVIGAIRPLNELPYYGIPFELIMRFLAVLQSLITVIFPAFSSLAATDLMRLKTASLKSVKFGLLIVAPITCGIVICAAPFLEIWMGLDYAENGALVLQLFAVSIAIMFIAHVPASVLLVLNRPDIHAKLNIFQLIVYFPALYYAVSNFGVIGAALVWFARTVSDIIVLSFFAYKLLPANKSSQANSLVIIVIFSLVNVIAAFALVYLTSILTAFIVGAGLLTFSITVIYRSLEDDEKELIQDIIKFRFFGKKKP